MMDSDRRMLAPWGPLNSTCITGNSLGFSGILPEVLWRKEDRRSAYETIPYRQNTRVILIVTGARPNCEISLVFYSFIYCTRQHGL